MKTQNIAKVVRSKKQSHGWDVRVGDDLITTTFSRGAALREADEYNAAHKIIAAKTESSTRA